MLIHALERTENDYDQVAETIAIWKKRPNINALAQQICKGALTDLTDEYIIAVVNVLRGDEVRVDNADWVLTTMNTLD